LIAYQKKKKKKKKFSILSKTILVNLMKYNYTQVREIPDVKE